MNEWTDGKMNGQIDGRRKNKRIYKINKWIDYQTNN